MSLRSLPLRRTLKKANITNPKCLPVSATTTAIGTRGVMPKEVSFSADPAHGRPAASRRPGLSERRSTHSGLIFHPTCVIKPAADGCPLVAANSMEIEKVRSFLLQIREKDHAAPLGGIVRVSLSPLVVFPK